MIAEVPIAVLTTSKAEADVLRSYDLGANCYISKPVGLDDFLEVIRAIEGSWLVTARLPAS